MKKPFLFGIILTACVIIVTFVFAQVYPVGMISYWKFDEDPGPTAFDSVDANDGTIYGATRTTGQVGGALSFDGFNDSVEVPDSDSLDITGDLTLEAWIEPDSVIYAAQGEIIGKWVATETSYYFAIRDGQLQMRISAIGSDYYNIEETNNANISIDTWYHVVGVYDASEQDIKLYINGVEESTTVTGTIPLSIHIGSANVKIGGWWPGYYFAGIIDEVAIYSRALTAEEIQHHYQDGLHGLGYDVECTTPPDNMVSWWPGDGDANDIVDGNNGTEYGATYAAGRVDQAFSFDGVDDYVEVPDADNLDVSNELTIDAWFYNKGKIDSKMRWQRIIHKNYRKNYEMWIDDFDRKLSFRIGNGLGPYATLSSGTTIQFDIWYHVAAVYDGTSMKLYLNGDLSNSMNTSITALGITADPVIIGNVGTDITSFYHNRPFNGLIDEVEIFNRALLQSEIQAIYLAGSAGKCKITNQPPVAVCKDIEIHVDGNCQANIAPEDVDGGSYDPDEGDTISLSVDNTGPFSPGIYTVYLTVTDESDESDTCMATVTVADKTPPTPDVEELPTVTGECSAEVTAPMATDNCAGTVSGTTNDSLEYTVQGTYTVTWTYDDGKGNIATQTQTVVVKDTTPPEISVSVSPDTLRPPNHKMVLINLDIMASDNCDSDLDLTVVLISITMDEGDDTDTYHPDYDSTLGDGHTTNDIQVINGDIYLRAERSGKGDGRIYEITYEVTDASGNSTTATAQVTVPHDRR